MKLRIEFDDELVYSGLIEMQELDSPGEALRGQKSRPLIHQIVSRILPHKVGTGLSIS